MNKKAVKVILTLWMLLTVSSIALSQSREREVRINGEDGFKLRGVFYSAARPGPGVLLLHQCDREGMMTGYERLATLLTRHGFQVLTLDFRGYGGSISEGSTPGDRQRAQQLMQNDVEAAYQFLIAQRGVAKDRVGVAGASCGGRQAILLAERHAEVKALILLSSAFGAPIESAFQKVIERPLFSVASEEDVGAVRAMKWTFEQSKHKDSRIVIYKGRLHGTPLFTYDRNLEPTIAEWLRARLMSR